MIRPRTSIAGLAAIVGVAAVGLAATRVASPSWIGGVFSVTILALLASILGIIYQRGTRRAFWLGFALFGWTHVVLTLAPWFSGAIGQHLVGYRLYQELFPVLHPGWANGGMGGFGGMMGGGTGGITGQMGGPTPKRVTPLYEWDFVRIGQSLEALLWAVAGGWVARYLAADRHRSSPDG